MRMQRGFHVAEDRVVDAHRRGGEHERITQVGHVEQELRTAFRSERIEIGHHRIRQQQQVTLHELLVSEHRPARSATSEQSRVAARARIVHAAMNRGLTLQ